MRTLITHARILDGTGAPAYPGEVLLEDGSIAGVGNVPSGADEVVDAHGMIVAPGFIDMHSHGDFTLARDPLAAAKILQGVTTEVVGNCGMGVCPSNDRVDAMYERFAPLIFGERGHVCAPSLDAFRTQMHATGMSVNAASLVPHGNVRAAVLGLAERAPDAAELREMVDLVGRTMHEGAFGVSTGLVYAPGAFSETPELIEIARAVKPFGGFYASHIRDEGGKLIESVAEAIRVGEEAGVGVQISHHKAVGIFNWGKVKKTLAMVDAACARGLDVHSDVYPYTAGATILAAMLLPPWLFEGTDEEVQARLRDPVSRARIRVEFDERMLKIAPLPRPFQIIPRAWVLRALTAMMGRIVVISSVRHHTEYEGMTLGAVARLRRQPFFDAMLDVLAEEEVAVAAIAHVMREKDVEDVMRHPRTMIGTDGFPMREGKPHPRTYGTYPRVLERYVRGRGVLSLADAIHRMTGLPARKLGMKRRGVLAVGAAADVVIFDADRVHDRATYRDPKNGPDGIPHVWVNGVHTVKNGVHTGGRGGKVLRREVEAR